MADNVIPSEAFLDAQFKDSTPEGTVRRIQGILAEYGIEVEELWHKTNVPYCFALSVKVVGTTFRVNGKGLSKEFARASAYGELMERLQLGYIQAPSSQKDGSGSYCRVDGEFVNGKQLLDKHYDWFLKLSDNLREYVHVDVTPENILAQYCNKNGNVHVTSFYSLNKQAMVHFPKVIAGQVYTSNGCAAGNSPEEAIVQALSELAERHHMLKTIYFGLTPPDIPEEVLKKFHTAYSIIEFLRANGFRVLVKDCSMGKKFPVVCVCLVDTKTGRYHTHFGAYPIFEIALERSLTETFQGRDLQNVAAFSNLLQLKPGETDYNSMANELVYGGHEKSTYFFCGNEKYRYNEDMGFTSTNNKDLLRECVEYFKDLGYEILVRDSSSLGFCTYQVIIPGYSEAYIHRLAPGKNEHRYSNVAARFFRNPSAGSAEATLAALMHLGEMARFSNIRNSHTFIQNTKLLAQLSQDKDRFLMYATLAYGYYGLGQIQKCIENLNGMLNVTVSQEQEYLRCLKRYLSLKVGGYDQETIERLLLNLHKSETVHSVFTEVAAGQNPLDRYTLHCDLVSCDNCIIREHCYQRRGEELSALISKKTLEIDPEKLPKIMQQLLS